MGQHDDYGKRLLRYVAGDAFDSTSPMISIDYGAGSGARIDGVVDQTIAVEVEARVSKQIRGAVLDLICHSCRKKLLIVIPAHADNPVTSAVQCGSILSRFLPQDAFRVIVLNGTGDREDFTADAELIRTALSQLGFLNAA